MTQHEAKKLLAKIWGFPKFRPGQAEVVDLLISGHSAAAVFPTGGGKSLCYQLPALMLDGLTLVVSPLIALMKDQIDALAARGVVARRIDSSLGRDELRQVMTDVRSGSLKLLYVAPERFNNERFRESLEGVRLSLFAVDEAHCISEWGHNFRPDYLKLVRFAKAYGAERVLALTATATPAVLEDICRQFAIAPEHAVRTPFYRSNLTLLSRLVEESARDEVLIETMRERPAGATIVYVTKQKTAEHVASMLGRAGFDAVPYHAGMKPERRSHVQDGFMHGSRNIVVATIAFGMGVDKADIRYVYHYNAPKSMEAYSQEIGRAGRDGEPSICEMLACASDVAVLENFVHGDTPSEGAIAGLLDSLFRLTDVGDRIDVSYYDLASTHDVRGLVVRTLLTYLELDGYLASSTPFYQSYRFKAKMSSRDILASHERPRRAFLKSLLALSVKARTWFTIDVEAAVQALGASRGQVVAALDELHDGDFIELQSSGVRSPFRVLRLPESLADLAGDLHARVVERERRELERLAHVFSMIGAEHCQVAMLSAHFGEPLEHPCGHCSACLDGGGAKMARSAHGKKASPEAPDPAAFEAVRAFRQQDPKHARALADPRAVARFLCGLTSPLTTRARLTRHALFGRLAHLPFRIVLEAAQANS